MSSGELQTAKFLRDAVIPGFVGFEVGRTTWWSAIIAWQEKKISQENAVQQIAKRVVERL